MKRARETRTARGPTVAAPGKLAGYAAVFDRDSRDLGGFTESIRSGAFTRTLGAAEGVMALLEHDRQKVLGRAGAGTLTLKQDERGLHYAIDLPDTSVGRDLEALVRRGDVAGASFAFTIPEGGDVWIERAGIPHRELLDVDLHEITITATPAYPDTSVAQRYLESGRADLPTKLSLSLRMLELESL